MTTSHSVPWFPGHAGLRGWFMYDWANSAYATTVMVAVLPAWFAQGVVPEGYPVSATTLWGVAVGLAGLLSFVLSPVLGAVADLAQAKARLLTMFCMVGAACCTGLVWSGPGMVGYTLVLFMVAQIAFTTGNVLYDGFLPKLARYGDISAVSARGFAWGYAGGGLQFALALGLVAGHDALGLTAAEGAQMAIGSAGIWWLFFGIWACRGMQQEEKGDLPSKSLAEYASYGFSRILQTTKIMVRSRKTGLFLLAFFFYNDGIQTVITMATIYGKEELGLSMSVLMLTLLMIQFVSLGGAELFGWLARRYSSLSALRLALVMWMGIAVYAYVLTTSAEYVVMGVLVGLVMGGSQALSRSIYGSLIPQDNPAEYFGYFSVVNKFSSILGPFVFAGMRFFTGSSRPAALALTVFFAIGLGLLWRFGRVESRS